MNKQRVEALRTVTYMLLDVVDHVIATTPMTSPDYTHYRNLAAHLRRRTDATRIQVQ